MTPPCVQALTNPLTTTYIYHIIIADDDALMRRLLRRIVEHTCLSFTASIAENGKQALEIYRTRGAGLLITDATMPVMDGIDLVQAVREETAELPIIMLSGEPDIGRKAYAAGVTVFLEKPASLAHIARIITQVLRAPDPMVTHTLV
jgi:YesN/AraC family two-component response regulator